MCGIFGIILKPGTTYQAGSVKGSLKKIALFSESRGKDSSGIAFRNGMDQSIEVIKGDIPVSELIKNNLYQQQLDATFHSYEIGNGFSVFGHARLVTNGSQLHEVNNQPVIKEGILIIHNGIIVNVDELWEKNPELKREYAIDTEIIPALIRNELQHQDDLAMACNNAFNDLKGNYSVAVMFEDLDQLVLATNNGSLYLLTDEKTYITFSSERYFLEKLSNERCFTPFNKGNEIRQLSPNNGLVINLNQLTSDSFSIPVAGNEIPVIKTPVFNIRKHLLDNEIDKLEMVIDPAVFINRTSGQHSYDLLEYNINAIRKLKRCTRCLLPETFPFITFDVNGVCNVCNNYNFDYQAKPFSSLLDFVEPYRNNNKPDCIVPYSGGRDSTFTLHYVKKELGLNPIAFTFDWGMVTDLARRNIARVCGQLGVEHIIVSANIHKKRGNIRKNVSAWLEKPSLGMVPLFMAGDKEYHHYADVVRKQNGLKLNIWGGNRFEKTDFKTGFCGVHLEHDKRSLYSMSIFNNIRLAIFLGSTVLKNPRYINSSIYNNLYSVLSRQFYHKQDFVDFFDYKEWNEKEIEQLLKKEYDWELSIDTKSTWRIGDGTAPFYNYIYYTVAGFSEFDSFRSNQIRAGHITREKALELIEIENVPRYESIHWYLDIIGLDFERVIKRINQIPKLYRY